MNKYWNLFIDEMKRSKHFFLGLVIFILLGEILSFIRVLKANDILQNKRNFTLELLFADNNLFWMMIAMAIVIVILYANYTWFREWHLQGRFIYRLLALPGSRLAISWAKWTSMMLMSLTMIVFQWLVIVAMDQFCQIIFSNYATMGWRLGLLKMTPINLLIPLNLKGLAFIILLISAVILIVSNLQIMFNSLKHGSLKGAFIWTAVYLALSLALIIFCLWVVSSLFMLTDRETFSWLLAELFFINLLQGLWMSFLSQRIISI